MSINEVINDYPNCLYYNEQWHKLAQKGDTDSIVNIGTDFARSEMMQQAVTCWKYIIDSGKGTAEAYSNLGVSYYYGNGVAQNYDKAVLYYQKAAAMGHPFGLFNLAVAYENGNGIEKNMDVAVSYYKMAAEKHLNMAIDALIRLGVYSETQGLAFYQRSRVDNGFAPDNINDIDNEDLPF